MKELNLITFVKPNINNEYIMFEKELMPRIEYENSSEEDKLIFVKRRNELLELVRQSVTCYLSDDAVCSEDNGFPNWKNLTGNYYVGDECYWVNDDGSVRISIYTRFTEIYNQKEQDYLALEVWITASTINDKFEFDGIDSSSI